MDNVIQLSPRREASQEEMNDAIKTFTEIAASHGLTRHGDPLDRMVIDAMLEVVERCAAIGDRYGDDEAGGNAGEHIRAVFGDL